MTSEFIKNYWWVIDDVISLKINLGLLPLANCSRWPARQVRGHQTPRTTARYRPGSRICHQDPSPKGNFKSVENQKIEISKFSKNFLGSDRRRDVEQVLRRAHVARADAPGRDEHGRRSHVKSGSIRPRFSHLGEILVFYSNCPLYLSTMFRCHLILGNKSKNQKNHFFTFRQWIFANGWTAQRG